MSDSWVRDRMQASDLPRPGQTAEEYVEAFLAQAGVATPVDPGLYGYLLHVTIGGGVVVAPTTGTLDFSSAANSGQITVF